MKVTEDLKNSVIALAKELPEEMSEEELLELRKSAEKVADEVYSAMVNHKMDQEAPRSDIIIQEAPIRVTKAVCTAFMHKATNELSTRYFHDGDLEYLPFIIVTMLTELHRINPQAPQRTVMMFMQAVEQQSRIIRPPAGIKLM